MPSILDLMLQPKGMNIRGPNFNPNIPPQPYPMQNGPMNPMQIAELVQNSPSDFGDMPPMDEAMFDGLDPQGSVDMPVSRIAPAIQEALGAKEPETDNLVKRLLANRRPASDFIGDAAVQTLMTGNPVSSQNLSTQSLQQDLEPLSILSRMQTASTGGATMSAAQQIMADNPGMNFTTAYGIAKSGLGQGMALQDGQAGLIPGFGAQRQDLKYNEGYGSQAGQNTADIQMNAEKEAEKQRGQNLAEKELKAPKAYATLVATDASQQNVRREISLALPMINAWTAGLMSSTAAIPGTPAFDLKERLGTIKANVGFDKLQEMRMNSPTGGALGQVAVQELEYLQKVWTSIEQAQSPQQLQYNLQQLDTQIAQSNQRIREAYLLDFGTIEGAPQAPTQNAQPQNVIRYDAQGNRL